MMFKIDKKVKDAAMRKGAWWCHLKCEYFNPRRDAFGNALLKMFSFLARWDRRYFKIFVRAK